MEAREWGPLSNRCEELNSANEKNDFRTRFSPRPVDKDLAHLPDT